MRKAKSFLLALLVTIVLFGAVAASVLIPPLLLFVAVLFLVWIALTDKEEES